MISESEDRGMWEVLETPFTIFLENEEYHVLIGKYRLNEKSFENMMEAVKDAQRIDLKRIGQLVNALIKINETNE